MNCTTSRITYVTFCFLAISILLAGCMGLQDDGADPADAVEGGDELSNETEETDEDATDREHGASPEDEETDDDATNGENGEVEEDGETDDSDTRDERSEAVADRIQAADFQIHPGMFTEFDADLLVGAHPYAIDEPAGIEVSPIDPTDPAGSMNVTAYKFHEPNIEQRSEFYELRTTSGETLESATHTKFYVTIPVPEELDETQLRALSYEENHIQLPPGTDNRDPDPEAAAWKVEPGTYDEQLGAFVVQLEGIGGTDHPTRLGVVEHSTLKTTPDWQTFEFPDVEFLATQQFPTLESEPWEPEPVGPPDIPQHGSHVYADDFSVLDDTAFHINCNAALCNSSVTQEHRNQLDHAYAVYFDALQGDPYPDIRTDNVIVATDSATVTTELYRYNIEDHNTDSSCEDSPGWYSKRISPVSGHGYTCLEWNDPPELASSPVSTTSHELFHGMQYSYRKGVSSDDIISEATASLAQNYETKAQARYNSKDTLPALDESMMTGAYAWDNYYEHLLATDSSVEFGDLAFLFDDGMNFDSLENWLGENGFRSSYWAFVQDTVFEQQDPTVLDENWSTPDPCSIDVFEQSNSNTFDMQLPVEDLLDSPDDGPIYPYGALNWEVAETAPFSSHVANITLPADGYDPYYATISIDTESDDPMAIDNWMAAVYDDVASEYEDCTDTVWLEDEDAGEFQIPVYGDEKQIYLLQSNLDSDSSIFGDSDETFHNTIEFEPIPEDEMPYPRAENVTLEYPAHPDDHDGSVTHSLEIRDPDGNDDVLDVFPTSVTTDARNELHISKEDKEFVYELDGEHQYSHANLADGEYTDVVPYHVTNERFDLTTPGEITVHRDVDPITYEVNHSLSWELDEIDPITPNPGPVCQLPENRDDANPVDYDGTPFFGTELFVIDAWGADPQRGTVSVNDDEKTVAYEPVQELQPWSFDDFGPDGYGTGPQCRYLDSFSYEVENSFRDRFHTGNAEAEVHIYDEIDESDIPESPPITTGDWLEIYTGTLDIGGHIDIQIGTVGGFRAGGYGMMTLEQDGHRTAYFQPGSGADWLHLGAELNGDLVMTDLNDHGQSSAWIAGRQSQAVLFDSEGSYQELPSGGESVALDMNERGETVGHAILERDAVAPTAVLWTHNQPFAIDAHLADGSLATATNDQRQIVGVHDTPVLEDGISQANIDPAKGVLESMRAELLANDVRGFLYDWNDSGHPSEGMVTELESFGGGATIPTDVSDRGAVVGASTVDPTDPSRFHAFYWEDGRMIQINLPDDAVRSTATAVNDDGYVVGSYERASGENRGFLWHPDDGFIDLDDRLVHDEWTLVDATAIDDDRRVQVTVQVTEDAQWPMTLQVPR